MAELINKLNIQVNKNRVKLGGKMIVKFLYLSLSLSWIVYDSERIEENIT
jgi:hypothetical protein